MVRFKNQISKIKSKELRVGQCRTCQTNLCALRSLEIPFLSWNGRCLSLKLCLCSSPACVAQHEDHLVAEFLNDATVLLGLKTRFEEIWKLELRIGVVFVPSRTRRTCNMNEAEACFRPSQEYCLSKLLSASIFRTQPDWWGWTNPPHA